MAERLTGTQFWKLRTKHGRDRLFGDPALLWDEACKYFDWCDRHPQARYELVKYKGDATEAEVPLGRPYSMDGLTAYLHVSNSYFRTAKTQLREKVEKDAVTPVEVELLETIEHIEQTVRTQQIEGAAVGIFNAGLISRLNGLADTMNVSNSGEAVLRVSVRDQMTADNMKELESLL